MHYNIIAILESCALIRDRITAKQMRIVISVYTGKVKSLSRLEKGNIGEMIQDLLLIGKGILFMHKRITSLIAPSHHGIDGLFYIPGQNIYLVTDAKFGYARLGRLRDGRRQLSSGWLDGRLCNPTIYEPISRLTSAVGSLCADSMISNIKNGSWTLRRLVVHVSAAPSFTVSIHEVDNLGVIVAKNIAI